MKILKVYMGADHAGYKLKESLKKTLLGQGYEIEDMSPAYVPEDDYPKYGKAVALAVAKDKEALGILVCGSGLGMAMAANRVKGARAFSAHNQEEVRMAREHNNANIITLSGWMIKPPQAMKLIHVFLKSPISKAARHQRRTAQLDQ